MSQKERTLRKILRDCKEGDTLCCTISCSIKYLQGNYYQVESRAIRGLPRLCITSDLGDLQIASASLFTKQDTKFEKHIQKCNPKGNAGKIIEKLNMVSDGERWQMVDGFCVEDKADFHPKEIIKPNSMYCSCEHPNIKITSTAIHGKIDASNSYKYCTNCKKEQE